MNLLSVSNESARQMVYQMENCALVTITCPQHSIDKHLFVTDLLANLGSLLFSQPLEWFTPSQRYSGLMLNMFGGGSGPLYTGFSVKEEKSTKKGKKDMCGMADY